MEKNKLENMISSQDHEMVNLAKMICRKLKIEYYTLHVPGIETHCYLDKTKAIVKCTTRLGQYIGVTLTDSHGEVVLDYDKLNKIKCNKN